MRAEVSRVGSLHGGEPTSKASAGSNLLNLLCDILGRPSRQFRRELIECREHPDSLTFSQAISSGMVVVDCVLNHSALGLAKPIRQFVQDGYRFRCERECHFCRCHNPSMLPYQDIGLGEPSCPNPRSNHGQHMKGRFWGLRFAGQRAPCVGRDSSCGELSPIPWVAGLLRRRGASVLASYFSYWP